MNLRILLATILFSAPMAAMLAQDIDRPVSAPAATHRVKAVPVSTVAVRAGGNSPVQLPFEVLPGYHINSNQPTSELLIPTVLRLDPPTDLATGKIRYPPGQDLSFAFAPKEKLNVYTGDFTIRAMVSAARSAPPGTYRVRGTLKYQACDNKACYPPGQAPVAFDVKVTPAGARRRHNTRQSPYIHQ